MLQVTLHVANDFGLTVSPPKTKVMVTGWEIIKLPYIFKVLAG
jgi:hypothetical protein